MLFFMYLCYRIEVLRHMARATFTADSARVRTTWTQFSLVLATNI